MQNEIGNFPPTSQESKMPRKPISSQKRYAILERDDFRCQVCGAAAPNVTLHVDHILAVSRGGTNDDENLRAICVTCNFGKGSALPPARKVLKTPVNYPIRTAHNDVFCRGEPLSEPIFWIGEQWAVTASGLEARDGRYFIAKHRLEEDHGTWNWEKHMFGKIWVNQVDFQAAIDWARANSALLMATEPADQASEAAE